MKPAVIAGVLLIILGVASLFYGIPSREKHGVSAGGADIGIETKTTKAVPMAISALLIVGGVVAIVAGTRR